MAGEHPVLYTIIFTLSDADRVQDTKTSQQRMVKSIHRDVLHLNVLKEIRDV